MMSETCNYEWLTTDRRAVSRCQLPTGHDEPHRSGPDGTCRACGSGVALQFIPGNRDEGRQAHWIGYCRCGCRDAILASMPDYYGAEPFPHDER